MGTRRHALFHAIVTMGAASVQGGCGGVTIDSAARGDGTAGSGSSSGGAANQQMSAGGVHSIVIATGGVHSIVIATGGATATGGVHSIFVGTGGASATGGSSAAGAAGAATMDAGNVTVPSSGGATAITDAGAPLGLCAHSEQLQCTWGANPLTCSCNLSAPLSGNDCPPCAAFYCHSYAPNVGCQCVICIR